MSSGGWYDWNTLVWWGQLLTAFAWAGLIVFLWLGWTGGAIGNIPAGNDDVVGMITIMTTGCCGFTWIVGLVPIALCFWLLRRPE